MCCVSQFELRIEEADGAPVDSWDFGWLDGRATEERPSWRYFDLVAERASRASTMLELQAGTGSMIGRLPSLPRVAVAAEGYPASVAAAAPRLRARGVHLVVTSQTRVGLPFAAGSFELAVSRHPIDVWWSEIAPRAATRRRVLRATCGTAHSSEPQRVPDRAVAGIVTPRSVGRTRGGGTHAGLEVRDIRVERPRVVFYDIGAVVYFLRLVPWIVPGFTVSAYRERLRELHDLIERNGSFQTTTSRTLIEAVKS